MNLVIAESAVNKLTQIITEENEPSLNLRVFVQGGGCSGMQYGFTFDGVINEDDFEIPAGTLKIIVDSISAQYLNEAEISYEEDIYGASFKIKNPNAETTCGCGSSFNPY